jgi:hypothetical protein
MSHSVRTVQSARIARFGSGATIIRARGAEGLSMDDMRASVPSVFAGEKHASRSAKYTYIPTSEVLNGLHKEGFVPFEARQGGSRDVGKLGFTKHLIRLRQIGGVVRLVGDSYREVILLNAHDGTSSYQMMCGMFRMVCSNGLVVADGDAQCLRIPHKGDIVSQVIDGAFTVIDHGRAIDSKVEQMRAITLSPAEQNAFAEAAGHLRFENGATPLSPQQINESRRHADVGSDLWRTFNRAQENLTQGGQGYTAINDAGVSSRRTTRPVNSIDGNTALNRALWTLTSLMSNLKGA